MFTNRKHHCALAVLTILVATLLSSVGTALGQEADAVVSTKGVTGGQVSGTLIIPPGGYHEQLFTLQRKQPTVFTGYNLLEYEFDILLIQIVGKGNKQKLKLVGEASGVYPVLVITPAKTSPYIVRFYNPYPFPIIITAWSN
jgi:hypothetical protein